MSKYNVTIMAGITLDVEADSRLDAERAALESVSLGELEVESIDVSLVRTNEEAYDFSE